VISHSILLNIEMSGLISDCLAKFEASIEDAILNPPPPPATPEELERAEYILEQVRAGVLLEDAVKSWDSP
jgi:hypothetical protein